MKEIDIKTYVENVMKKDDGYASGYSLTPHELKKRARDLCRRYNGTTGDDPKERLSILRELFGDCSEMTVVEPSFRCDYGFNIHTSGLTLINFNCVILDTSPVTFGENVFVGPGVCISCAGHPIHPDDRAEGIVTSKPIHIGNDVWIGAGAVICGGVSIGDGTVIGAGSVVTRDIPEGVVAVGVPCREIRKITPGDRIDRGDIYTLGR